MLYFDLNKVKIEEYCIFFFEYLKEYIRNNYVKILLLSSVLILFLNNFNTLLELIIFMPLLGFLIILCIPQVYIKQIKLFALAYSFIILNLVGLLWIKFNAINGNVQFVSLIDIFQGTNIYYHIGIDGISIWFIILTAILIPICFLLNWKSINYRIKEHIAIYFLIEFLLFNVFSVLDLFLFYIFFESILIPMFCLIGIWGSRERKIHAAYQFFLYTVIGSIFMLLGLLLIYYEVGSTNWYILQLIEFSEYRGIVIWFLFFIAFAVKVPMFPVHIWLPEAHVEAPTGGSVLLAGILLKMGTFGMLRYCIQLMPIGNQYFMPLILVLSILGIIYGSLTTIRQIDLKKSIAYSSVAHMSFVTLGMVIVSVYSIEGALYMMIGHGLVSSALFICIGIIYDRYHTRILTYYGGLIFGMPLFSIIFYFCTLSNINFPGTCNYVGELLISLGVMQHNFFIIILASVGMILGVIYAVWLYNRIFFGTMKSKLFFCDINRREFFVLLPLLFGILIFGFLSKYLLQVSHATIVYHLLSSI